MNRILRFLFATVFLLCGICCLAQKNASAVNVNEVRRIENVLAADVMRGRKAGSPEIEMAAAFIANEFGKAGLQPLPGNKNFLQEFVVLHPQQNALTFKADGADVDAKNVLVLTSEPELEVNEGSGYEIENVNAGESLMPVLSKVMSAKKNTIVLFDTSFAKTFPRLAAFKRQQFKSPYNVVMLLAPSMPKEFKLKAEHSFTETRLFNVVGMLPGKSKPKEQVAFSSHYDHIGVGQPVAGDSIYNGANDDAAGTTAVILLAKHFAKLRNNERSLIFAAFTAEEIGGFGSQYFSRQLNPEDVVAMFNIEMIGTESKWGKGSAYITGYEKTNMGEILQANLKGTGFSFYPDPYPQEQLFYRSDNATLARLGVPAHTISTSKMDNEPNYHQPSDEVKTLDLENMVQIINAIAKSSKSIVSGKDTPTRVKAESLR